MEEEIILSSDEEVGQPFDQLPQPPRNYALDGLNFIHRRTVRHQITLQEIYQRELTDYVLTVRTMIRDTRRRIRNLNNQLTILERQRIERVDRANRRIRLPRRQYRRPARGNRNNRRRLLETMVSEAYVTFRLNIFHNDSMELRCSRSNHPGYLCCVCHEDFDSLIDIGGMALLTPCQHQVCTSCMETLIKLHCIRNMSNLLCPLCRQTLITPF
jgi:hypothetical protein